MEDSVTKRNSRFCHSTTCYSEAGWRGFPLKPQENTAVLAWTSAKVKEMPSKCSRRKLAFKLPFVEFLCVLSTMSSYDSNNCVN